MAWVLTLVSSFVVLLLVIPLVALVGSMVFLWVAGTFFPARVMVSKTAFRCPFSKRTATVEFLSEPGAERPSGVLSCSVFRDPHQVRCKKGCLELAETGWAPAPMVPAFALLSGGVAYRTAPPLAEHPGPGETPKPGLSHAA